MQAALGRLRRTSSDRQRVECRGAIWAARSLIDDAPRYGRPNLAGRISPRIRESRLRRSPGRGSTKIRIGYFSADFRAHPVAFLTAGLFERHDRTKFEVTAFAFGPEASDPMVARLTKAFDRFIDVRQKSDLEVAALARELEHRHRGRSEWIHRALPHRDLRVASRPDPDQLSGLSGHHGCRIHGLSDRRRDGRAARAAAALLGENRLSARQLPALRFELRDRGQRRSHARSWDCPPTGFVFCCFNNSHKITARGLRSLDEDSGRTENSVLWLQQANAAVRRQSARGSLAARHRWTED